MNELQTEAVSFFLANAGWGYNPETETPEQGKLRGAIKLAEAEQWAKSQGHTFVWEEDWLVGSHVDEFDAYDSEPEICESATMLDSDDNVLASLGCVDDATDDYRRVVEAELALEAMPAWFQLELPLEVAS